MYNTNNSEEKANNDSKENRTVIDYKSLLPKLPFDKDGYVQAFDIILDDNLSEEDEQKNSNSNNDNNLSAMKQNKREICDFFDKYGVVVIKNILTPQELELSQQETLAHIEHSFEGFDRNIPNTWDMLGSLSAKLGLIGDLPVMSPQICKNRVHPKIYKAYSYVLGTEDVYTNVGRVGWHRPTKQIAFHTNFKSDKIFDTLKEHKKKLQKQAKKNIDENKNTEPEPEPEPEAEVEYNKQQPVLEYHDFPRWQTIDGTKWLHTDYDPITNHCTTFGFQKTNHFKNTEARTDCRCDMYDCVRTQGILSLDDCSINDGGFQCVVGFHKIMHSVWVPAFEQEIQKKVYEHRYQFSAEDAVIKHITKCPLRAGSLLIWNSKLPHNNFPNDSNHHRMVQYIKYGRFDDRAIKPVQLGQENIAWGYKPFTPVFPKETWDELNMDSETSLAHKLYRVGFIHPDDDPQEEQETVATENDFTNDWNCVLL